MEQIRIRLLRSRGSAILTVASGPKRKFWLEHCGAQRETLSAFRFAAMHARSLRSANRGTGVYTDPGKVRS